MKAGDIFAVGPGTVRLTPTLDWETYSEAGYLWVEAEQKWRSLPGAPATKRGLEVVGLVPYVTHPSFVPLCLSYDLLDGKGLRSWVPPDDLRKITLCEVGPPPTDPHAVLSPPYGDPRHPWDLLNHVTNEGELAGWNVAFERTVWNLFCVPRWGWPRLRIEQTYCDMAKSRASAYPGKLAEAGRVLKLHHQKDPDGDRLLKKFSVPRNPTKHKPNKRTLPADDPEDFQRLIAYNQRDVLTELEASLRIADLSPMEREIWIVDQRVNERGIRVDLEALENCIAIVEQAYARYNAELRGITGGEVPSASAVEKLTDWLQRAGCNIYALDEETITEKLKETGIPGLARRALEIRQALASASIKKLYAFKHQNYQGRLYWLYVYAAARTLRWAGHGPQPQNLPKGGFKSIEQVEEALEAIATRSLEWVEYKYGDALETIASCLRGLLVTDADKDFICADFSAIEGVTTAALAGEEWRLEVFRTHGLIYEQSASDITGVPFDDFIKHKQQTGQHHPLRNSMGKFAELASGFNGWIGAWKNFGADEFLTDDEIKRAVLIWRDKSPAIPELWGGQSRGRFRSAYKEYYGLEGAAIMAVLEPGKAFQYREVIYQMAGDALYCRVPSGGVITYHHPRLEKSEREWANHWDLALSFEGWNSNQKKGRVGWIRMPLYSGGCIENVVQRVARDIQAHALVQLDRAGYRPVLHSHDEIAGEVPRETGDLREFEAIMGDIPWWARSPYAWVGDWPVRAKGWRGSRYRKD